jgi:predicted outer membrane repeat protein
MLMKLSLITMLTLTLMCGPWLAFALEVPGGDVSGSWSAADSPVLVSGEISIQAGQSLSIAAGVEIRFQGNYKFNILGQLLAVGAEADSIIFTAEDPGVGWGGLRFIDTDNTGQPASEIAYSRLEYGIVMGSCPDNSGGAIMCSHSSGVTIRNNLIVNNTSQNGAGDWGGGGIYCEYCSPDILHNEIAWNSSGGDGGSIYCTWSQPRIEGNIIHDNSGYRGGGIVCFSYSSAEIWSNIIENNGTHGIYLSGSSAYVANNIIRDNTGSGIECYLVSPRIVGNLLTGNNSAYGAAIFNRGSSPYLNNNTIAQNIASTGGGICNKTVMVGPYATYSNPVLNNCILWGNTAGTGSQISSDAGNGCVINYSCVADQSGGGVSGTVSWGAGCGEDSPLFIGIGDHPFSLDNDSWCRNGGIPDPSNLHLLETDLAGNDRVLEDLIDIGCYEFSPGIGVGGSPVAAIRLWQNYPNPFNPGTEIVFTLPGKSTVSLKVYDPGGRLVATLVDESNLIAGTHRVTWNGADNGGKRLPSGVYLYRLSNDRGFTTTRAMTLLK